MISCTLCFYLYSYYLYKCGAPSGLHGCVNGLFWLRECVKMEKKLREYVNWKNLCERENPLLDCENAWICPIFAWIREFSLSPQFSNISPIFPKIFPDFPKNRVCALREFPEKFAWMRELRKRIEWMREFWVRWGGGLKCMHNKLKSMYIIIRL